MNISARDSGGSAVARAAAIARVGTTVPWDDARAEHVLSSALHVHAVRKRTRRFVRAALVGASGALLVLLIARTSTHVDAPSAGSAPSAVLGEGREPWLPGIRVALVDGARGDGGYEAAARY